MPMFSKDHFRVSQALGRATLALTGTIALVGCAGAGEDELDALAQIDPGCVDGATDAGVSDVAADAGARDAGDAETARSDAGIDAGRSAAPYFASIVANGTGCPAGTWDTRISDDGMHFLVTFSAFEASLTPTQNIDVVDCQLAIKLRNPEGYAFTVTYFTADGYAYLPEGVSLRHLSTYYFQGDAVKAREERTELKGPYDDTFLIAYSVPPSNTFWSPCGVARDLNVRMMLRLDGAKGQRAYAHIARVPTIALAWKRC